MNLGVSIESRCVYRVLICPLRVSEFQSSPDLSFVSLRVLVESQFVYRFPLSLRAPHLIPLSLASDFLSRRAPATPEATHLLSRVPFASTRPHLHNHLPPPQLHLRAPTPERPSLSPRSGLSTCNQDHPLPPSQPSSSHHLSPLKLPSTTHHHHVPATPTPTTPYQQPNLNRPVSLTLSSLGFCHNSHHTAHTSPPFLSISLSASPSPSPFLPLNSFASPNHHPQHHHLPYLPVDLATNLPLLTTSRFQSPNTNLQPKLHPHPSATEPAAPADTPELYSPRPHLSGLLWHHRSHHCQSPFADPTLLGRKVLVRMSE
ncbi:uncharacterized protein LOC131144054 [Malania oleifera]|uniref:uncharacterized protein LOC131144054 n=1 Tax=Malania oleifera TaxID=397392 RepID=UPI0025AE6823|nr:uncharacterized protein LOC131144054 [Malania oleifera]